MVRRLLSIALSFAMLLASLPHLLCPCGCGWLEATASARAQEPVHPACPHCRSSLAERSQSPEPTPSQPPCRCDHCGPPPAVLAASVPAPALPATGERLPPCDAEAALLLAGGAEVHASPPLAALVEVSALPVRALPILLGHLLL